MSVKASKQLIVTVLLVIAIQILSSCGKEPEQVHDGVKWLASYDEALEIARKRDLPIMIDFYADWCSWCKRLDSDTYIDGDVMSKANEFVSLRIDADVERDLSFRYRIRGLPTILFIDHTGQEIHRVVGYRRPRQFVDEMDLALKAFHGRPGT